MKTKKKTKEIMASNFLPIPGEVVNFNGFMIKIVRNLRTDEALHIDPELVQAAIKKAYKYSFIYWSECERIYQKPVF